MMRIQGSKMTPTPRCRHHYLLNVHKSDWLRSEYHVEFLADYGRMLADWYSPEQLRTAWMVNFFDRQALYALHPRARYDTYSAMHYSREELEALFIQGIGSVMRNFAQRGQCRILFWLSARPALGRYYNYLLKKQSVELDYRYRMDIQREAGIYVIETGKYPRAQEPEQSRTGRAKSPYLSGAVAILTRRAPALRHAG
ncbi:hypothetical protein [Erwinia aphidicola]|uniref:hypothetical protein n=1 Tax=Erwinia aphidicola TaxID=68334 RepID=UPI00301ACC5A